MKKLVWALGAYALLMGAAFAADVNCCKSCCRGANCIMTHGAAHDCVKHPPCK